MMHPTLPLLLLSLALSFATATAQESSPVVDSAVPIPLDELDVEIDFVNLPDASASQDFADPYVGLSWQPRRGDWEYLLEGDVGGGVDADFAWSMSLGATYHFNDRIGLTGGYRFIDIDYDDDDFVFDGTLDGIQIGVMITFQ